MNTITKADCTYFDGCSAPICPMDADSVEYCAWFPDEEICRKADVPDWVRRQKKTAKKVDYDFERGCFTMRMLERKCMIKAGTTGVDPNKGDPHDLEDEWLENHPTLIITDAQREARVKNAAVLRE